MLDLLSLEIGRFHPLVVHLPIGVLYVAGLLYFVGKWKRSDSYHSSIQLALGFAVISAILASFSGWMMAGENTYGEEGVRIHKWLGFATTGVSLVLYFLSRGKGQQKRRFGFTLIATLILLTITGHYGGDLTHGQGFLFAPSKEERAKVAIDSSLVYTDLVAPILQDKCASCHNPNRTYAGFDATSIQTLHGTNGFNVAYAPEDSARSMLLERVLIPNSVGGHMPPKGTPQLTLAEVNILKWWVANGSCGHCPSVALHGFADIRSSVAAYLTPPSVFSHPEEKQLADLKESGVVVSSYSATSPMLGLSLEGMNQVTDDMLDAMEAVAPNIEALNLAESVLSEDLLELVFEMPNLNTILVQKTTITADQLVGLRELKHLAVLNIYGTELGDECVHVLGELGALKRLYAWDSAMTDSGFETLAALNPGLDINKGADEHAFPTSQLNPPIITAESPLFRDSTLVQMESFIPESEVHYTTDGGYPDWDAPLYTGPFYLHASESIRARAMLVGWDGSNTTELQVLKVGLPVASVSIDNAPDSRYAAKGANSLIDLETGLESIASGTWLGYQGKNLTAVLELEAAGPVSSVFVSALSNPGSWVHFPRAIQVYSSNNGTSFKKVGGVEFESGERFDVETKSFEVPVEITSAKYIKVVVYTVGTNPFWHPSAGQPAWLFVDEILVEAKQPMTP